VPELDETCEGRYSKSEGENDLYDLRKEEELTFAGPICNASSPNAKIKKGNA